MNDLIDSLKEKTFSADVLRRIEFIEMNNGTIRAFDMRAFKKGEEVNDQNTLPIFNKIAVLPQAYQLILAAPMLYKVLLACHDIQDVILNTAEAMEEKLKSEHNVKLLGLEEITSLLTTAQSMIIAALSVPLAGRDESINIIERLMKNNVDKNGNEG